MDFSEIVGFDWDDDNVYDTEAEQVFFNHPLIVRRDVKHSKNEECYFELHRLYRRHNSIRGLSYGKKSRYSKEVRGLAARFKKRGRSPLGRPINSHIDLDN